MTIKKLYEWACENHVENCECEIDERNEMPPYELLPGNIYKTDDGETYVLL